MHPFKFRPLLVLQLIVTGVIVLVVLVSPAQLCADTRQLQDAFSYAVMVDPSGAIRMEDILKGEVDKKWSDVEKGENPSYGFTTDSVWVRFTLNNDSPEVIEFLLRQEHALIDDLKFYHTLDESIIDSFETGDLKPFSQRPINHRCFVFPLKLPPQTKSTYYLRFQSQGPVNIHLSLLTPKEFKHQEDIEYNSLMFFHGIFAVMIIYHLFVLVFIRRLEYFYYVGMTFFMLIFMMTQTGAAYQYLWPNMPRFANQAVILSLGLLVIFILSFTAKFLDAEEQGKKVYTLFRILKLLVIALLIASFFFPYNSIISKLAVVGVIVEIMIIYAAIKFSLLRLRKAYFFSAAFTLFILGAILFTLKSLGLIQEGFVSSWSLYLGSTALVVMLSIALADNINNLRKQMQSLSVNLEEKVRERTRTLETLARRLEKLSTTDGLTEISNRRHFDRIFQSMWLTNRRYEHTLSVSIIDVDHFKAYNDFYGHQEGDECLKSIARTLNKFGRRGGDLVARYGGEEFAIILSDIKQHDLMRIMSDVRKSIEDLQIPHLQSSSSEVVTVSIGVSMCIPTPDRSLQELLKNADEALYLAKDNGRNRIE
ncbi:MAG: diguanylate cyclase, partial [bacterium]